MKKDKCILADNQASQITGQQCRGSKKVVEFGMIPLQDLAWVMDQNPAVIRLFHECWLCEPYGSRWMQLNTILKDRAFREAKKRLSDQGLFIFKRETSIQDSRSTVCWMVKNLHGSRVKGYWEDCKATEVGGTTMPECGTTMPECGTDMPISGTAIPECGTDMPISGTAMPPISPQNLTQSGSQDSSTSFQYYFNIFSVSLSTAERENFEKFVREEWRKKTTKPGQPGEEIISLERFLAKEEDCKNWYALFLSSSAGRAAKLEVIAAQYDWLNDPRFDEWLKRAFYEGIAWAQEDEAEREQRSAFLDWAQATDPYKGRLY